MSNLNGYVQPDHIAKKSFIAIVDKIQHTKKTSSDYLTRNSKLPSDDPRIKMAQGALNKCEEAESKLHNGTYGICTESGKNIPVGELLVNPLQPTLFKLSQNVRSMKVVQFD